MARRFGNYVEEGELGRGGMGVVFLARHPELGRVAAVKVLAQARAGDPDAVARFFDEARAASAIRHPGIVEVFDLGLTEERDAYYVMELLQGESLAEVLARGPMVPAEAARVGIDVAAAVGAAHAAGIVHRDLKPANVFLTHGGGVKVLDFGVAKLLGELGGIRGAAPTVDGAVMGTPHYMAPEQAMGRPVDMRADIYALGAILYESLCGMRPFEGDSLLSVAMKHATEALVAPTARPEGKGIPPALERVVMRAMAKAPADRFQSMAELKAALRAAVGEPSTPGLDRTLPAPSGTPSGRMGAVRSTPSGRVGAVGAAGSEASGRVGAVSGAGAGAGAGAGFAGGAAHSGAPYSAGEPPSLAPMTVDARRGTPTAWLVAGGAVLLVGWLLFLSVKVDGGAGCGATGTGTGVATGVGTGTGTGTSTGTATGTAGATAMVEAMPPPLAPRTAASSDAAYAAYLRGMDACAKFRMPDAMRSLGEATTLDPDFPQPHLMIALYELTGPLPVEEHLARAEAMAFKLGADERVQLEIARALNRTPADHAGAEALLVARVARFPGDVFAWFKLGETRASLLDDAGALVAMDRVVALAPSYHPARNSRAYLLERLGRVDEALKEVDLYVMSTPSEPNPYDTRGDILLYAGRFDEAVRALGTALALDPKFSESLTKSALLRFRDGAVEEALKMVPLAEATPSNELGVWLNMRVELALATGRVGEALSILSSAVGVVPAGFVSQALENALKWTALVGLADDARTVRDRFAALGGPKLERARMMYASRFDSAAWSEAALDSFLSISAERGGALAAKTRRSFFLAFRALAAGTPEKLAGVLDALPGLMGNDPTLLVLRGIGLVTSGNAAEAERVLFRADMSALVGRVPAIGLVARFYRGRALEALERRDEARAEYRAVASAWGRADRTIELGGLARTRLAVMGDR